MEDDDLMVTITIEPPEASFQQLTGLDEEQALDLVAHTLAHVGVETPVEVGILISTDDALRILNRDFREIDATTDVLSFPFQDEPIIEAPAEQLWQPEADDTEPGPNGVSSDFGAATDEVDEDDIADELEDELDDEEDDRFLYLGDVAISHEAVAWQAAEAGHSVAWECAYLLTHGVLHLVGYDDKTDAGYQAMVAQQEAILAALDITK